MKILTENHASCWPLAAWQVGASLLRYAFSWPPSTHNTETRGPIRSPTNNQTKRSPIAGNQKNL